MCNLEANEVCETQRLAWKLQALRTSQFMTDQNGVEYVRSQFIENLEKELQCLI